METDGTAEGIRVGAAKYGKGVYATKSFVMGEFVGQVVGRLVNDCNHESDYCIELSDDVTLEPATPFRYVNHSCSPNCQLVHYDIVNEDEIVGAEIWLETIRPITENEQLTIDYAWPADVAIRCGCESENCRGWIVAEDELDRLTSVRATDTDTTQETTSTLLDRTELAFG